MNNLPSVSFEYTDKAFGVRTFTRDERGQWTMEIPAFFVTENVKESAVIDVVKGDKEIIQKYFPMYGFHS